MTEPISDDDLAELEEYHQRHPPGWPCETARVIARLRRAEAMCDAMEQDGNEIAAIVDALRQAEAERDAAETDAQTCREKLGDERELRRQTGEHP